MFGVVPEEEIKPMTIVLYRAVHMHNRDIKYACANAIDTSGYYAVQGPPDPDAQLFLCEDCSDKLEAGAEIIRKD